MCLMGQRVRTPLSPDRLRWNRRAARILGVSMLVSVLAFVAIAYGTGHWLFLVGAVNCLFLGRRLLAGELDPGNPAGT